MTIPAFICVLTCFGDGFGCRLRGRVSVACLSRWLLYEIEQGTRREGDETDIKTFWGIRARNNPRRRVKKQDMGNEDLPRVHDASSVASSRSSLYVSQNFGSERFSSMSAQNSSPRAYNHAVFSVIRKVVASFRSPWFHYRLRSQTSAACFLALTTAEEAPACHVLRENAFKQIPVSVTWRVVIACLSL